MNTSFLKFIVLLFAIMYSSIGNSQSLTLKVVVGVDGTHWFMPNMNDMIRMYHMKLAEWENEMKLLGAKNKEYISGKTVYKKINGFNTQGVLEMEAIAKEPEEIFIFYSTNGESSNILTHLINELEPYYIEKDNGDLIYQVTRNNNVYLFIVSLESNESQSVRLWSEPVGN